MGRNTLRILPVLALLLAAACGSEGEDIHELWRTRMCRANLNAICTGMACYRDKHGEWAASLEQLAHSSGRSSPTVCPESGLGYVLSPDGEDGYRIECLSGHGSITTGRRSWCEGSRP